MGKKRIQIYFLYEYKIVDYQRYRKVDKKNNKGMRQLFIPYGHQDINKEDIAAVSKVLKSDCLTQGPTIEKFEKALAKYVGAKHAVVFNSGTAALHAAYFAVGLQADDEFITTPITFAATANAGIYLGAKPVFVDIEPGSGNIDASLIENRITKKTKLIVPVHYGGNPVELQHINHLAKKHRLTIIEDACHALGGKYYGNKMGNCRFSSITAFSFHPVKHITTGEGGAATTNDKQLYEKMLVFRTHGITKDKKKFSVKNEGGWYHEMQYLGFNYRLSDIQAALGISQLKRINNYVLKRRKIAQIYDKAFADNPYFDFIPEKCSVFNAYHLYPIILKDEFKGKKRKIFAALRKHGLGVQVHYIPTYQHPFYQNLGYGKRLCPRAEDFYQREISIPIYPSITGLEIDHVVKTLFKVFNE
jgi:UDP-4-amino-4,6-dideoxy-N-acetyl-beta-L-altrosamine transaminase